MVLKKWLLLRLCSWLCRNGFGVLNLNLAYSERAVVRAVRAPLRARLLNCEALADVRIAGIRALQLAAQYTVAYHRRILGRLQIHHVHDVGRLHLLPIRRLLTLLALRQRRFVDSSLYLEVAGLAAVNREYRACHAANLDECELA